ncbi:MAG: 1-deoxy-D-xylulose-5-phosphate reductoisomerase [Abditibacteriota bacterium]|nr:1-deoxy-D-xylulose-5-phosphate reductoisomerase [Abditibacteriota bacterium]
MINISVLGSTGSIGTQVLDVAKRMPDLVRVAAISAMENHALLLEQASLFHPDYAVIGSPEGYDRLKDSMPEGTRLLQGAEGLLTIAALPEVDKTVVSVAGFPGFEPTLAALKAGKQVCLASKEVLVEAGHLVFTPEVRSRRNAVLPIDSEHSAIFQCLNGESPREIRRIILTASGGPFRDTGLEDMARITVEEALDHPTWKMGRKVTVDSSTLMNKGLEIIEAKWLFGLEPEQISVLMHRESIVHSMIEFRDSAIIAQLGMPDMRVPIQYALLFPRRQDTGLPRLDLARAGALHFEEIDRSRFPAVELAMHALKVGGSLPCVMSAADNAAVQLFLQGKIGFLDIVRLTARETERAAVIREPSIEEIISIHRETERRVLEDYA